MLPRAVKKRIRPIGIAAIASAAWMNRQDLARWFNFAKRAIEQRHGRPVSELVTEARVRAAVTADPVLRRDPALADVRVDHGVVTLLTTTPTWPDNHVHLARLRKVKGIADVTSRPVEASMAGAFA